MGWGMATMTVFYSNINVTETDVFDEFPASRFYSKDLSGSCRVSGTPLTRARGILLKHRYNCDYQLEGVKYIIHIKSRLDVSKLVSVDRYKTVIELQCLDGKT